MYCICYPKNENAVIIYLLAYCWRVSQSTNISGSSEQNSVTAFSQTTEVDGDKKKQKKKHTHKMASWSSSGIIQIHGSPEIPNYKIYY